LGRHIVTNGDFVACAEVRELIELSFGVMSGVGSGIHVLDGGSLAPNGRGCLGDFGICAPIGLNGQNVIFFTDKMCSTRT